jgi:hypothetical protein
VSPEPGLGAADDETTQWWLDRLERVAALS